MGWDSTQHDLELPIVQGPMAGGPSTPELAIAVSRAGGLGFLAGGYKTAKALGEQIAAVRGEIRLFGVNLFVPDSSPIDEKAVHGYRDLVAPEAARRYSIELDVDVPGPDDDDWTAKLDLLVNEPVPVVSFTFGCPSPDVIRQLQRAGSAVIVTVTTPAEAEEAAQAGADALCVQGLEAGGHRASFRNDDGDDRNLLELLPLIREKTSLPLIAAGGLMTGGDIARVLEAGAVWAQLGTAFLCCPESGTHPAHRAALTDDRYQTTVITRAFTGRRARGLLNRFIREHDAQAPCAYPYVHHMTKNMRRAAAQAGDPDGMSLWAGTGYRQTLHIGAAELIGRLAAELR